MTCPPRLGLTWFNNNFDAGTTIPYTNTDYVSQGLAYWPAKDWLITSLSDDTWLPGKNILAVKNRSTGTLVKKVFVQYSNGAEIEGHMGGVSVAGGSLLLSTSSGGKNLFRFSLRALELAPHNTALKTNGSCRSRPARTTPPRAATSTSASSATPSTGRSTMWRYKLSSTQAPTGTPVAISTPTRVQGAVVADGHYIFSTSYGRNCYSRLKFKKVSTGSYGRSIEIPPMSEGIVNVPRGAAGPGQRLGLRELRVRFGPVQGRDDAPVPLPARVPHGPDARDPVTAARPRTPSDTHRAHGEHAVGPMSCTVKLPKWRGPTCSWRPIHLRSSTRGAGQCGCWSSS